MTLRELIGRKDIHLGAQLFVADGNGNPVRIDDVEVDGFYDDKIILFTDPTLYQRNTRPKTQNEYEA